MQTKTFILDAINRLTALTDMFYYVFMLRLGDNSITIIITRDACIEPILRIGIGSDPVIFCRSVLAKRDRSKSDVVRILFCVVDKPHESHKNTIKLSCTIFQVF